MDDKRIIDLLYARDEAAVTELEKKYGGLCMCLISRILPDRRDAEECMSSVFMKLWRSIPPAKPENLKAYVAKIARNEAIASYRRIGTDRGSVSLEELDDFLPAGVRAEDELEAKLLTEAINRFLSGLDPKKRMIFLRRCWCFESVHDIAKSLSMSEKKVSDILFKTKRSLKTYLMKEKLINE